MGFFKKFYFFSLFFTAKFGKKRLKFRGAKKERCEAFATPDAPDWSIHSASALWRNITEKGGCDNF